MKTRTEIALTLTHTLILTNNSVVGISLIVLLLDVYVYIYTIQPTHSYIKHTYISLIKNIYYVLICVVINRGLLISPR